MSFVAAVGRLDFKSIQIKSFGSKSFDMLRQLTNSSGEWQGQRQGKRARGGRVAHIYNCSIQFPFECVVVIVIVVVVGSMAT